ncbi:MAG: tetratricopeptide repeat protein [Chloroflexota bacterium]
MMSSENIIEVNEASFQHEVIIYSNTTPVVVDFWAEWSQPCRVLSPILEKLATEANGAFRLAKVNADENPNLTMQLNIQSLPSVKAFARGQKVNEFSGAQTESTIREFLRSLAPDAGDLDIERGRGLMRMQQWEKAALSFKKSLKTSPDNTAALLGLAKTHLAQGDPSAALPILMAFPAGKELSAAEQLGDLAAALTKTSTETDHFPNDDLGAAYQQALKLITIGNLPAAADGLLDILRTDKKFLNGEVHRSLLGLLVLMESHPEERKYRAELASVLF